MYNNALKNKTKLFKAGNSWNFRVTSKDRKALDADQNTIFEKIIDPNGQKIIFKKWKPLILHWIALWIHFTKNMEI